MLLKNVEGIEIGSKSSVVKTPNNSPYGARVEIVERVYLGSMDEDSTTNVLDIKGTGLDGPIGASISAASNSTGKYWHLCLYSNQDGGKYVCLTWQTSLRVKDADFIGLISIPEEDTVTGGEHYFSFQHFDLDAKVARVALLFSEIFAVSWAGSGSEKGQIAFSSKGPSGSLGFFVV